MKKRFLANVALAAMITSPAIAADLRRPAPVYQPPPPPPVLVVWTWTGCYIGGHVGGLWAGREVVDVTPVAPFLGSGDHNVNGWLGGVQAGCDYQFAGGWVIGIQADYAWTSAEASHISVLDPSLTIQTQIEFAWVCYRPVRLCLGSLPRLYERRCRLGAGQFRRVQQRYPGDLGGVR